jgi:hypothetical protein
MAILFVGLAMVSSAQIKGTPKSKSAKGVVAVKEQTLFGSEEDVKHKINIPKDVLEQLGEYDNRRLEQCQQGDWRESKITNHFAATKISLNDDKLSDMVVQAQTLCFMGAHNTTFWIFTDVGQRLSPGYELVFDKRADFLEVLKTTTNGYRDIETGSHTAVEMYTAKWKFDGQKYQPRECKVENFNTKRISRIKCDF